MRFAKYHGLGNDFLIVDLRAGADAATAGAWLTPATVRALCERRFGVGADGVLALLPPREAGDARMRVLNADGGEAEMCGNGLRCVVKHLYERDPSLGERARDAGGALVIETGAGALPCRVHVRDDRVEAVTVNMGRPELARGAIPMAGPASERCVEAPLNIAGNGLAITAVSMGNPHAVAFVDAAGPDLRALAEAVGPEVERHAWFPRRTNVELAHLRSAGEIELVVWERGCGITLACGTGACATAVAACITGRARAGAELTVRLPGGALAITVAEDHGAVWMRGPAVHVFDGTVAPALLAAHA